jgi:hypothetical protein
VPGRIVLEGVPCTILYPTFRETSKDELRRISLPRTRVNKVSLAGTSHFGKSFR